MDVKIKMLPEITEEEMEQIEKEHIDDYQDFVKDTKSIQMSYEEWIFNVCYPNSNTINL